ncbi:MAG: hypothetical protein CM15mL7_030 [uncultured marine virus]|nr:MAG: hypothetical protein CM15mL7_030 [uncultured marine virus]
MYLIHVFEQLFGKITGKDHKKLLIKLLKWFALEYKKGSLEEDLKQQVKG